MSKDNASIINEIIKKFQNGEINNSILEIEKYLKLNLNDEIALYNYGYMLDQIGKFEKAIEQYKKVILINKNNWKAKFNLYVNYIRLKLYDNALELVNDVLEIKKNFQPDLRDKALILYYKKKPDIGLSYILESIKLNEKDYLALNILGLIYVTLNNIELAEKNFRKAIEINNNYAPSYNNLGRLYDIKNNKELAYINYNKALEIDPDFQEAINNKANYYNNTGQYLKAIEFYKKAQNKKNDDDENIIFNIGISYMNLEKYHEAEKYFEKAYKINSQSGKLKQNYGILLLSQQRFREAWDFYEGRLKLDEFKLKNDQINIVKNKLWDGKSIKKNSKILIIKEQGVGDEILYSSMYEEVLKKYKNIEIETDKRLIPLFKNSFNSKSFVPVSTYSNSEKKLDVFDEIIYAASLGKIFRNKLSDFPRKDYLLPSKKDINKFSNILLKIDKKIKIGISWKSRNEETGNDKSLDLNLLAPIINNKSLTFINMQYGDTDQELDNFNNNNVCKIHTISELDLFNDFSSMAGLIKNLDLFISVSSTTAHLSAAVGTPTWIIKPKNHVLLHYWNQPKNLTPWYSSVKLFPYKTRWEETVNDIEFSLSKKFNL